MSAYEFGPRIERVTTGIPGLDRVLDGGFLGSGVYIIEGVPGAGKTILANQIAFHRVKEGGRVLYVTLLAESHARLLQHMQSMAFFDPSVIPERLTFVSGFGALEDGGLRHLLDFVRKELRLRQASTVVLDGFVAVRESAASDGEFKKFVNELQVNALLGGCTFFLLSSHDAGRVQPIHTMVDGLLRLDDRTYGARSVRELQVQKLRGSGYLRGVHTFEISSRGIELHPRLESFASEAGKELGTEKLKLGSATLDAMLHGGLGCASTTMVLGPTGVGKSVLGYQFLAAASADQKGLLFSFYETPDRALAKARAVGIPLEERCQKGQVELVWRSPVEGSLDAIGGHVLDSVDRVRATRLFFDGFNALEQASSYTERVAQFFGALARELRARGVTTVYSAESHDVFAYQMQPPMKGVSPILENLILLRFVEVGTSLRRLISVLKLRDSDFDPTIRRFVITKSGLDVTDGFHGTDSAMTGVAHKGVARRGKTKPTAKAKGRRSRS